MWSVALVLVVLVSGPDDMCLFLRLDHQLLLEELTAVNSIHAIGVLHVHPVTHLGSEGRDM